MGSYSKALQGTLYSQGRSVNWLSQASGVSFGTIAGIIYKGRIPRIDTALKIAAALDMSIEELYLGNTMSTSKEKQDRLDSVDSLDRLDSLDGVDTKGARLKGLRDKLEHSKIGILTVIQDIDRELENYSTGYSSGAPVITEDDRELQVILRPE